MYSEATHLYHTVEQKGENKTPKTLHCKFLRTSKKGEIVAEVLTDKGTRYKRYFLPHQLQKIEK